MTELLSLHLLMDFFAQSDEVAKNKSRSVTVLLKHVLIYSLPFILFGVRNLIIIAVTHFLIDFVTSKLTTRLWIANQRHWFFCVIGVDQYLHMLVFIYLIK